MITATIPFGWHIYSTNKIEAGPLPTSFQSEPPELVSVEDAIVTEPVPVKKFDSGFKKTIELLEKTATFSVPLKIAADAKPGSYDVTLSASSQLCDEGHCMLPKKAKLALKLTVGPAKTEATPTETKSGGPAKTIEETKTPAPAKTESIEVKSGVMDTKKDAMPQEVTATTDESEIAEAKHKGVLFFFLFAAAQGALALLTPCVFPMIPITVSFFTKRKQATRAASIRDAAIYALGIILTFTIIGMIFAIFFKATSIRDLATNPWVNLAVGTVFSVLAMNLFGVFEVPLPTGLINKVDSSAQKGNGVVSILLMAFVFSITSFTCTVPFVGTTLLSAAQGEWFMPMVGMLGFSAAFALPFFVLALFPTILKSLPKSGGWMNSVKVVMGFLELAAALKFWSTADIYWNSGARFLPRELFIGGWIALAVLTTLYLLGVFKFSHDSQVEHLGGARISFAAVFLTIAFWLSSGFAGNTFGDLEAFIPQKTAAAHTAQESGAPPSAEPKELPWLRDFDEGMAEAKRSGKPLMLDFTGFTCGNCRVMEAVVFPSPQVQEKLSQYVRVKLYTDDDKNAAASMRYVKMQEERFESAALPFYVLLSPDDKVLGTRSFDRNPDAFAAFLQKGLSKMPEKN